MTARAPTWGRVDRARFVKQTVKGRFRSYTHERSCPRWVDAVEKGSRLAARHYSLQLDSFGGGGGHDGSADKYAASPDRKPPKVISPSDPQSAWTAKANKRVLFGYGLNYLIDIKINPSLFRQDRSGADVESAWADMAGCQHRAP